MTVKELIEKLTQMPPDAPVICGPVTDFMAFQPSEVETAQDRGQTVVTLT